MLKTQLGVVVVVEEPPETKTQPAGTTLELQIRRQTTDDAGTTRNDGWNAAAGTRRLERGSWLHWLKFDRERELSGKGGRRKS
ncbi:hypothetical protein LWI29_006819 [Acer saccharum]|uniref:Uncharacterized protein n=1 Tax=Acer saccharum TaxID=4024 RepID=A0AA39VN18_ACESA|nr:hypothetical protein LWI29_006819 [Acer saccharum]